MGFERKMKDVGEVRVVDVRKNAEELFVNVFSGAWE